MKQFAVMAMFAATSVAQMTPNQNLFLYMGSCQQATFGDKEYCESRGKANSECCKFHVKGLKDMKGQFCMTDDMRQGEFNGEYEDADYTEWVWECYKPPPPPEPEPTPEPVAPGNDTEKNSTSNATDTTRKECKQISESELPIWNTYYDEEMEMYLWATYLSGEFYLIGLLFGIPMGFATYGWMMLTSVMNFFEIFSDDSPGKFGDWIEGPFWRAWLTGPIIFGTHLVLAMMPGINFISSYYMGYLANIDYYGDGYKAFQGPVLPTDCELAKDRYFYFW